MENSNTSKMNKKLKETINFNKEIFFGEIGALVGTQIFGHYASKLFISPTIISGFVVLGAIVFASLFWLAMRLYDRILRKKESTKMVKEEISYFVPASIFLTLSVYYPVLFYSTRHLLRHHDLVTYSAIISQTLAFLLFLIGINAYRYTLIKLKGIVL